MALDLIIRNAFVADGGDQLPRVDIGVQGGVIVAIEPRLAAQGPEHDANGKLVTAGLVRAISILIRR